MANSFSVAAVPYRPTWHNEFDTIEQKLTSLVAILASRDVKLIVLPEYAAMELASLAGKAVAADLQLAIDAVSSYLPEYHDCLRDLATRYELAILAGTAPIRQGSKTVNVATLISQAGKLGTQEKLIATRFEREQWNVHGGSGVRVFDLGFVKVGIAVCYDVEFPLISRAMSEAGAEMILCPSCTDSQAGYQRVQIGARARALENQCYVLQSPLVGDVDWCPAIDGNYGASGFFAPSDVGFPANGIVAIGGINESDPVCCQIDLRKTQHVRREGQVLNFMHWSEQPGTQSIPVETIDLT